MVGRCLDQLVLRHLRGVSVRGTVPGGAAVWAANHHSWWDYFAGLAALRAAGRGDVGVLMDPANIGSRTAFGWAGAIGTDRLRTAQGLLSAGGVLVLFPEGSLRTAGPLGPIRPGAGWLAERTGTPLLAAATRVVMRGHQAPEAYIDLTPVPDAGGLARTLSGTLNALDAALADGDPEQPLPGYRQLVRGARSWSERIRR